MTHQESLYGKTPDQLAALCGELGMPRFAARQIARWLYVRHTEDPLRMTDIAAAHRQRLAERFSPALSAPERVTESADGTKKYLFRTLEGHYVESAASAPRGGRGFSSRSRRPKSSTRRFRCPSATNSRTSCSWAWANRSTTRTRCCGRSR